MLRLVYVLQGEFQDVLSLDLLFKSTLLNYLLPWQRVLMRFGGFGVFSLPMSHIHFSNFRKIVRNLTQKLAKISSSSSVMIMQDSQENS